MEKVFIVLPTYNEKENIGLIIPRIFEAVPNLNILVVDDNSPDQTAQLVEEMQKEFPSLFLMKRKSKEGLGRAYLDSFREILKDEEVKKIVTMDADFSHNPDYLPTMLKESENYDVVIGSRYVSGGKTVGWELWRILLSKWGNFYARIITGLPVRDLTGGFNLISCDYLRKIDFNRFDSSGYAYQIELKSFLYKAGARFKEVPIIFRNRAGGESKISNHIIKEGILAPWKIRFKK